MSQDNAKPTRRQLSDGGRDKLEKLEGFKPTPSLDCKDGSAGRSVGFGINSQGQPKLYQEMEAHTKRTNRGLTQEEARTYTKRALKEYETTVRNLKNSENLKQSQFDALVM